MDALFRDTEKLFIIKGTPGCGKSTLMKRIFLGKQAVAIHCSADNDSFDGVIFPELKAAVADGTAPHVIEPVMPMIRDKIIDITGDYDNDFAEKYRDVLQKTAKEKNKCFENAYSILSSCGSIDAVIRGMTNEISDTEKIKRYVSSFLKDQHKKGTVRAAPAMCFNGKGFSTTLNNHNGELFVIKDIFGISETLLNIMADQCKDKNIECAVIPSPVSAGSVNGIILNGKTVVTDRYIDFKCDKTLNSKRFIYGEAYKSRKRDLTKLDKLFRDQLEIASEHMKKAKEHHEHIEGVYAMCADYKKADMAYIKLTEWLFGE